MVLPAYIQRLEFELEQTERERLELVRRLEVAEAQKAKPKGVGSPRAECSRIVSRLEAKSNWLGRGSVRQHTSVRTPHSLQPIAQVHRPTPTCPRTPTSTPAERRKERTRVWHQSPRAHLRSQRQSSESELTPAEGISHTPEAHSLVRRGSIGFAIPPPTDVQDDQMEPSHVL